MKKLITRRTFMEDAAYVAVGSLCVGLIGCETQSVKAQKVGLSCNDTTGLTPEQIAAREALKYVDTSAIPSKRCDNCNLWIAPEKPGTCGGCKILKGPFHPAGFCTAWAPGVAKAG